MKLRWLEKLSRETRHPSVEDLLLYLDGEAEPKRAGETKTHLESCWACRARREKLERSINELVAFAATAARPPAPRPQERDRFLSALQSLAEEQSPAPLLRQKLRGLFDGVWEGIPLFAAPLDATKMLRLSVGALMLCLCAAAFVWLNRAPSVSARELIDRAARAETQVFNAQRQPVIYQKVKARRLRSENTPAVTLEVWRDLGNQRQRVVGAGETLWAELEQVWRANGRRSPLSVAEFSAWRSAARIQSEAVSQTVLPDGAAAWRLAIVTQEPYAVNALIEVALIVRKADWHVVEQRLKVQGEGQEVREYELSELAYEVLPLQALTVFADIAPTSSPAPFTTARVSPSISPTVVPSVLPATAPSIKTLPSETELKEAEVAALYALHQLQADLGEQLEVARDANHQIVVRGLVERAERKQQLTQALSNIPWVAARIQTVEEATQQAAQQAAQQSAMSQPTRAAQANTSSEPLISITAGASGNTNSLAGSGGTFEQRLARYFGEREKSSDQHSINLKVTQLSNEVVAESSAALAEAWALRRLLERYPADSELTPAARQRVAEILANHLARLKAQSNKLRARLEPILLSIGKSPAMRPPSPTEATKQEQVMLVFKTVEQVQQTTHRLFAGDDSPAAPEEAARQLLGALNRMEQALLHFELAIAR